MAGVIDSLLKVLAPKRMKTQGQAQTNTYSADRKGQTLSTPTFQEHLTDIFSSRASENSQDLLQTLFVHDPDVSAAVNAFLTVSDTEPLILVRDQDGNFDRQGQQALNQILSYLTTRYDYSKGFQFKPTIRALCEDFRYMLLLRGGIGAELVFDKNQAPSEIRQVDMATVKWYETEPNWFIPLQEAPASGDEIDLNIATFFVSFFRRDPTSIYTYSPFVSAINTVAARQQVINDLYRIMKITGYPRIEATVLEEVLLKNAPADIRSDGKKQQAYVESEISSLKATLSSMTADQAFVHTDAIEIDVVNDSKPSNSMNIDSIIGALNAMNQAGLRSMATILGRGESGVNTASVEARVFSMHAESLNKPIGELLSNILTMALRIVAKSESSVTVKFRPVELRPATELEPQLNLRAARLRQDLSDGLISDDEYHLEMYGRIRPEASPELSGTKFMTTAPVDTSDVATNDDPMGRSLTPEGGDATAGDNVATPKS